MAFYTPIAENELAVLLQGYGVGARVKHEGASDGIENSTYFLQADGQQWVLTLFESLSAHDLPFYINLMFWLRKRGLPVACPLVDHNHHTLHTLSGKPALLFPRLAGTHVVQPNSSHCAAIGAFLGAMHVCGYPHPHANLYGATWMQEASRKLQKQLSEEENALLAEQVENARYLRAKNLPQGLIHGDLFRDNALFAEAGERLAGVIDFYSVGTDLLLLDLAIAINDWCVSASGVPNDALAQAMVSAYCANRPVNTGEKEYWQAILQLAAARFWLSRLLTEHSGSVQIAKPSIEYRQRLLHHLRHKITVQWG